MLKFFKHSYIAQLVVIVLLIAVLWIPALGGHVSAMTIFTFVVFGVSVFFFNSMLSVNQLVTRNSSIGALVFVLCLTLVPINAELFGFYLACPIIMMVLQTIYLLYQIEKPEPYLMNAGFFLALASMFYHPAIILVIWVLLAMLIMDIRSVKLFLIPIMGFVFPYFILFVYFYFNKTLIENVRDYALAINELRFMRLEIGTAEIVVFILVFISLILSLMMIKSGNADNSMSMRKKVNVTIWLFVFSLMMLFLHKPVMSNGLIFMTLAVFVSMALCYVKKSKIIDIVLVLMMLAIIANQYLPLFGIKI